MSSTQPYNICQKVKYVREIISTFSMMNHHLYDLYRSCLFKAEDIRERHNTLIDVFYLLEDTQEAKKSFRSILRKSWEKKKIGEIFLLTYGVLNSCYLQKEGIEKLFDMFLLKENSNKKELNSAKIIDFRNIFAAHTIEKRITYNQNDILKKYNVSYMIDREQLREKKLSAVSCSKDSHERHFLKQGDFEKLLNEWDELLQNSLDYIIEEMLLRLSNFTDKDLCRKYLLDNKICKKDIKEIMEKRLPIPSIEGFIERSKKLNKEKYICKFNFIYNYI